MGYTDAQGRPELVVHPDIFRGFASYRHVDPDEGAPEAATAPTKRRESAPIRRRAEDLGRQRNAAAGMDDTAARH
jgi:hypothetical protein